MAEEEIKSIKPITIEDEMRNSYLDYAMSVIIGRAIPDIRDGLKPVHRRILYAMWREGLQSNKRYSKCAGVVGEVLKKYHPHGDMAVYDSLVRMAQDWNLRYPLIDGQGNFGSIDGDRAAAYRYTESRLEKLADEFLGEIDQDTVEYVANYDGSTKEPVILPSMIPNFLVNGTTGIAVGMATNVPPHNLTEVMKGIIALIDNPELSVAELMEYVPAPDLPTGALICGTEGVRRAYLTGRGSITMRAVHHIEEKGKRENIIVTEIPYQVNKSSILEQIARQVSEKKIEGISDLRDESNREGIRMVIELKKDANAEVVINQLFKRTQLQDNFGITLLAITDKRPKLFNLKEVLQSYIDHRKEIVVRRSVYELRKAQQRAHILEGYLKALDRIDEVIETIRASQTPDIAKTALVDKFDFTIEQASAILEMRLQRLTGLEREKIESEHKQLMARIGELKDLLGSKKKIFGMIRKESEEVVERYGDERRTKIVGAVQKIETEDLIAEEDMVVTLSHSGYIKRAPTTSYRAQKRGGTGKIGMTTKDEDFIEKVFVASTHSYLMLFSDTGRVRWLKVHEIPLAGRTAKGRPLVNLVKMGPDENLCGILAVRNFEEGKFVIMATQKGIVKKTDLMQFARPRASGIIAINFDRGDKLIGAVMTNGNEEVLISSKDGISIRFSENDVRAMGRAARGVKGIELKKGDHVVSLDVMDPNAQLLTVCEKGYGKRTEAEEYRTQSRGGKGIITIKTTDRNGSVIGAIQVKDKDEIMLMTTSGKLIRMKASEVGVIGRNTQGMRLISLDSGEKVASVARISEGDEAEAAEKSEEKK